VAAERASGRPETSLAGLVAELADERRRLDLLDAGGDLHTAVRAVFSWSYQHLDKPMARAFRLLGLHPGPDLDLYAAAALTGMTPQTADVMLRGLARAHLIQPARPGHYAMHDLLRAYARELATCEAADDAGAALTRLFDFYLAAATTAMDMAFPAERDGQPRVGPPVAGPQLPDPATARAWLDGELANLVAVVAHAAEHTWSNHATRLAATLYRYLDGGRFAEALAIHSHARLAAHRAGDLAAEAEALTNLGVVDAHQCRYQQASRQLEQSLPLFRTVGDLRGEARALSTLGFIDFQQSRYQQAAAHLRRSLTVHRALADPCGEARALSNLGLIHLRQGRHAQAVGRFQRARTLMAASGNRYGEAHTLSNLGEAELRQGRCSSAVCYFQQSLAMFREIGDRPGEAYILTSLGDVELRQGSCERAIAYHRRSMLIFEQTSDLAGLAKALNSLGEAFLAHQPAEARTQHAHALGLARQIDDQYEQARAQHGLGHAYHALDDPGQARHHWRLALGLYGSLGTPEVGQIRALLGWQAPRRWSVLEDLDIDDSDSPAIGLVPPGVSWDEVHDHIKIAHSSLLVLPDGSDQYAGAYWTGTEMVVVDDLGPDQDEAVEEFRGYLRERGET
ncbi:MAG: tetratricopeptide repeat protein, partial [Streptosporangiaceae bacterium]